MTRSEEELRVGTTEREAGRLRLKKYVVEEEVTQTVSVRREEVRDRAEKWRNGPSFFGGGQEPVGLIAYDPERVGAISHAGLGSCSESMTRSQSTTTIDRGDIGAWIEERDDAGAGAEPGVLRIEFLGGADDDALVSSEGRCERWRLAFLYQRSKAGAQDSTFFELAARD